MSVDTHSPVASLLRPSRGLRTAIRVVLVVITALVLIAATIPTIVVAEEMPVVPPVALRLDPPEPEPELIAPEGSRCPDLYPLVVEHWPNAALHWPVLDHVLYRESRCRPWVVNRQGCIGLFQVCRVNHRRMGVTRSDLLDPATNIEVAYRLCQEWVRVGRSCYRPWWLGRWRP